MFRRALVFVDFFSRSFEGFRSGFSGGSFLGGRQWVLAFLITILRAFLTFVLEVKYVA